jgi:hypothetical protein
MVLRTKYVVEIRKVTIHQINQHNKGHTCNRNNKIKLFESL